MAMDKIVDSAVLESNLTAVADAIRAKTGGSDALAFPDGMVEAIEGISGGGESGGGIGGVTAFVPRPVEFKEEFTETVKNTVTIPYRLPIIVSSFEEVT